MALSLRSLRYPIFVRVGTIDVPTVVNNAIREEYGQFASNFEPKVIVDAGAYIGDTSAIFFRVFPHLASLRLSRTRTVIHSRRGIFFPTATGYPYSSRPSGPR